jgi:large subunit ribosomal protein L30
MPASRPSLRIKLVKSAIGYTERQKATVRALGLRRLQQVVVQPDNEAVRGMIFKIQHLVSVEPAPATEDEGRETEDGGSGRADRGAAPPSTVARRSSGGDTDETA